MSRRPLEKVAVFGATSGIAQAIVRLLARRGAELFLVGRDPARLDAVADDARVRGAARVTEAVADLNDAARHGELLARATAALGRLDLVVVAHGVLAETDACEANAALVRELLVTNLVAPALLCDAIGARLSAQGSGTLAGLSSVAGDRGRQENYAYGASKAGFSAFLSGLRQRLYPRGVHVVTVKPGPVYTPMTSRRPQTRLTAPAGPVAARILRGIERGEDVVYAPRYWRAIMWIVRAIPERVFKRQRLR